MVARIFGLASAVFLTFALLYLSRFWIWQAPWSSDGLFGLKLLSPYGSMVSWWLRGTWAEDFSLIIWACGGILALSLFHRLASKLN